MTDTLYFIACCTQVKATDRDLGVNARLSYHLSPQTTHEDVFTIDADTGQIYIRSALDYERSARYHLTVMACDGVARNQLEDDGLASSNVTTTNKVYMYMYLTGKCQNCLLVLFTHLFDKSMLTLFATNVSQNVTNGVQMQIQIQMRICRARLTNCPGTLTKCQNAM